MGSGGWGGNVRGGGGGTLRSGGTHGSAVSGQLSPESEGMVVRVGWHVDVAVGLSNYAPYPTVETVNVVRRSWSPGDCSSQG